MLRLRTQLQLERPQRALQNYHVLWEAEWEPSRRLSVRRTTHFLTGVMSMDEIAEVMAMAIGAAMGDRVGVSATPQSTHYARAALTALEKHGYVVLPEKEISAVLWLLPRTEAVDHAVAAMRAALPKEGSARG